MVKTDRTKSLFHRTRIMTVPENPSALLQGRAFPNQCPKAQLPTSQTDFLTPKPTPKPNASQPSIAKAIHHILEEWVCFPDPPWADLPLLLAVLKELL